MPIIINHHGFGETNVTQPHDTGFVSMQNCFNTGAGIFYFNAGNVCGNNNLWAITFSSSSGVTQEIRALNPSWPTIPTASIINGIQVQFVGFATARAFEVDIRLILGGVKVGSNRSQGQFWFGTITRGGPTDLWGTTLTAADLNSAGFGFSIQHSLRRGLKRTYGTRVMLMRCFYTA